MTRTIPGTPPAWRASGDHVSRFSAFDSSATAIAIHQAGIVVCNNDGPGCTVTVRLPLKGPAGAASPDAAVPASHDD